MPENLNAPSLVVRATPMGGMPRKTTRIAKSSKRARRTR
jgi:hypothetical protein